MLADAADINGATPYALRHSFASEGVPAGVPLEVLADLAGHRDVETTDRIYRARRDDVQRAGIRGLRATPPAADEQRRNRKRKGDFSDPSLRRAGRALREPSLACLRPALGQEVGYVRKHHRDTRPLRVRPRPVTGPKGASLH